MECLSGLKSRTDVQRVCVSLLFQPLLTLIQSWAKKGVSVGGHDYFPRLEVEGYLADVLFVDGETIDHTIGDVLIAHGLNHAGNDDGTRRIVA